MNETTSTLIRSVAAAAWFTASVVMAAEPISGKLHLSPSDGRKHTTAEVIQRPDGSFLVAWYAFSQPSEGIDVVARLFDNQGAPLGEMFEVNTEHGRAQLLTTAAVAPDGRFVIAWRKSALAQDQDQAVYARLFRADGTPMGPEFKVNVDAPGGDTFVHDPSVAMFADGRFVIVWSESESSNVVGRLYGADGQPLTSEIDFVPETWSDAQPEVVVDSGAHIWIAYTAQGHGPVATGQDVYLATFDSDGLPQREPVRVNTQIDGSEDLPHPHFLPSLAISDYDTVSVSWLRSVGSRSEVYLRRYSATGTALTEAIIVTGKDEYAESLPQSVAVDRVGQSLVAWLEDGGESVRARSLGADGRYLGDSFHIAAEPTYMSLTARSAAFDDAMHILVTWSAGDLFGRRYAAPFDPSPPPTQPQPHPAPDAGSGGGSLGVHALIALLLIAAGRRRSAAG